MHLQAAAVTPLLTITPTDSERASQQFFDRLLSDITASLTSLFSLLTASNDGLCFEARELKINSS